ncbi:MAG: hypothetical protein P8I45_01395 [Nitrospinaceae bacterium]|nr:hypothetical protein [Nitrospinaceae bacterium]
MTTLLSSVSPEYSLNLVSAVDVHSQTFPDVSNNPKEFGFFCPTG